MPLQQVEDGWRWGDAGKIYRGPNAKRKAMAQAVAIMASQRKISLKKRK